MIIPLLPQSLLDEFDALSEKKNILTSDVLSLSEQLKQIDELCSGLRFEIKSIEEKKAFLEQNNKALKEENEQLTTAIASLDEKKQEYESLEARVKELTIEVNNKQDVSATIQTEIDSNTKKLEKIKGEYSGWLAEKLHWQDTYKRESELIETRWKEISQALKEIEGKETEVKRLLELNEDKINQIVLSAKPISFYVKHLQKELDRKGYKANVLEILKSA